MKSFILTLVLGASLGPSTRQGGSGVGGPLFGAQADSTWNHEGRDYWPIQFEACNGKRQSPINIMDQDVRLETDVEDLKFIRYNQDWPGEIVNNGHVLQFNPDTAPTGEQTTPRIKGGALGKGENFYLYDFLQAHFHWGSHSGQGSEHKINDVEYPMELHIVHTRTNFADDVASAVDPDNCIANGAYCGLSVVGLLFHRSSENNTAMDPFVDAALEIGDEDTYAGQSEVSVATSVNFMDLINQVDMENNGPAYYYYKGSLTTPGCNEVVNWIVLENTIPISEYQLEAFRKLKYADGAPMVDNYRHPQPVNNRVIKRVLRDLRQVSTPLE